MTPQMVQDPQVAPILRPPQAEPQPGAPVGHLTAERSAILWCRTPVQKWLKTTAQAIVEGVAKGKGSEMAQEAANWGCVRRQDLHHQLQ